MILSIDTSTGAGKITFRTIKGCYKKDYTNGNALKDWRTLCNKYIDKSTPTLNKIKIKFVKSRLKKNTKDPEEWTTELEEPLNCLEYTG